MPSGVYKRTKNLKDPNKHIIKNCLICGIKFESYVSEHRKYCSRKCQNKRPRTKEEKIRMRNAQKGKKGPKAAHWKGGRTKHKGYILIYTPQHPFTIQRFYVKEHRLVMEKHLGRYLRPEEVVHHINHDKTDNRIENLQLFKNHSEHINFVNHRKKLI